jgi:copper chaperone
MSPTATATFIVTGMTCGHCAAAVRDEVRKVDGVTGVEVDLASGRVSVASLGPVEPAAVSAAVEEAGYEVAAS